MWRIRKRYIGLTGLAVLLLGGYFGCVHRFHSRVEHAGWSVDFSYILLACSYCFGYVEHLTFDGQPFRPPEAPPGELLIVLTPVGHFDLRPGENRFRAGGVGVPDLPQSGAPLEPAELERGYYDADGMTSWPVPRRPGTPAHWCFVTTGEIARWLDPARLSELAWPTSQPGSDASEDREAAAHATSMDAEQRSTPREADLERFVKLPIGCPLAELQESCGPPIRDHGSGLAHYEYRLHPHGFAYVAGGTRNTVVQVCVVWSSSSDSSLPGIWSFELGATLWAQAEALAREHAASGQLHDPLALLNVARNHSAHEVNDRLGDPIVGDAETGLTYLLDPRGFAHIKPATETRAVEIEIIWWAR